MLNDAYSRASSPVIPCFTNFDDFVCVVYDQRRLATALANADDGFVERCVAGIADEERIRVQFGYFFAPISHGVENSFRDVA